MNTHEVIRAYAELASIQEACNVLIKARLLKHEDQVRLLRKFLDDRPEFKGAVAQAVKAT